MLSRATILLSISQIISLISGFLIHVVLARILGIVNYGLYGIVMSILLIVELFVITGIPEAMIKFGGSNTDAMRKLVAKTLKWQALFTVIILAIFWIMAPFWAKRFGDLRLTFLLRIASFDIVFYGLYKYFLGIQNGQQNFFKFTIVNIIYSVSKLIAVVGLVWLGYDVAGALVGNVLASVITLIIIVLLTRLPKSDAELENIPYFSFVIHNVLYFVGLHSIFSIDLWFVKYFLSDVSVGLYVSASTLAKQTYMLSLALSAVLLPAVSKMIKLQQHEKMKMVIQESLRYLVIFLVLIVLTITINANEIIILFFGMNYINAAPVLILLTVGTSAVTVMAVINTVLIAHNKMKACFIMLLILFIFDIISCYLLVPRFGIIGAALATLCVGIVGTLWGAFSLIEELKDWIFSLSIIRIVSAAIFCYLCSWLLNLSMFDFFFRAGLIIVIYFIVLWITKELSWVDFRRFKESVYLK